MKITNLIFVIFVSITIHTFGQTNSNPEIQYGPKNIRVVDKLTGLPITGAVVRPTHLHMDNAYARKTYRTDTNGIARPIVDLRDYSVFKVSKDGFKDTTHAFLDHQSTNRVIPLKRLVSKPKAP